MYVSRSEIVDLNFCHCICVDIKYNEKIFGYCIILYFLSISRTACRSKKNEGRKSNVLTLILNPLPIRNKKGKAKLKRYEIVQNNWNLMQ